MKKANCSNPSVFRATATAFNIGGKTMKTMTQQLAITVFVLTAIFGLRGIAQAEVAATGGDQVIDIALEGNTSRLHVFTNAVGTASFDVDTGGEVDILIVAGGAGGGAGGGGGGAGGVVLSNMTVVAGSNYTVVVGDGGVGARRNVAETGSNGSDSSFGDIQAIGGGGGGSEFAGVRNGLEGGSGGGASMFSTSLGGTNTPGQGFEGGDCAYWGKGGGGGGASQAGYNGTSSKTIGGKGGEGTNMTYMVGTSFGEDGYFAGGGGGGMHKGLENTERSGGLGGGGNGNSRYGSGGLANTGGGGGAGGDYNGDQYGGGKGGSGIVIVRYEYVPDFTEYPYPFTLADIGTGSEDFTNSNEVEVAALPVPEGYTHYQITESGDKSAVGGSWTATGTLISPTFTTPSADTNVTLYAWYTNTSDTVVLQRGEGSIYYTTVAPPDPPVRATRLIVRPPDQPIEILAYDLDFGATGGEADGRAMEVFARRVVSADDPTLDQTPGEAYLTLAGTEPDGEYPLRLWVQNEAGTATLSSSTTLVTVETAGAGTNHVSYLGGYYDGWDRDVMTDLASLDPLPKGTILLVR